MDSITITATNEAQYRALIRLLEKYEVPFRTTTPPLSMPIIIQVPGVMPDNLINAIIKLKRDNLKA